MPRVPHTRSPALKGRLGYMLNSLAQREGRLEATPGTTTSPCPGSECLVIRTPSRGEQSACGERRLRNPPKPRGQGWGGTAQEDPVVGEVSSATARQLNPELRSGGGSWDCTGASPASAFCFYVQKGERQNAESYFFKKRISSLNYRGPCFTFDAHIAGKIFSKTTSALVS